VYPVNARYDAIETLRCYPTVAALPEVPDCAVVALAREGVEEAVRECVAAGWAASSSTPRVRGDRPRRPRRLQARLTALVEAPTRGCSAPTAWGDQDAARARMLSGACRTYTWARAPSAYHPVRLVAMSLGQAVERGVSVSHAIPVGNAATWAWPICTPTSRGPAGPPSPACRGRGRRARLIRGGGLAHAAGKPPILYKMAVGEAGARRRCRTPGRWPLGKRLAHGQEEPAR